jgi:hypothetical protein
VTLVFEEFPEVFVDVRLDNLRIEPKKGVLKMYLQGCDASVLRGESIPSCKRRQ